VGLSALGLVAGFATTWAAIGDASEGRANADPPILDLPNGTGAVQLVGLLLGGAALLAAVGLLRRRRWRGKDIALVLIVGVGGAFYGLGARVVAARTYGANIGGGGIILASPVVLLVLATALIVALRHD
jgi:hypothetical protein